MLLLFMSIGMFGSAKIYALLGAAAVAYCTSQVDIYVLPWVQGMYNRTENVQEHLNPCACSDADCRLTLCT